MINTGLDLLIEDYYTEAVVSSEDIKNFYKDRFNFIVVEVFKPLGQLKSGLIKDWTTNLFDNSEIKGAEQSMYITLAKKWNNRWSRDIQLAVTAAKKLQVNLNSILAKVDPKANPEWDVDLLKQFYMSVTNIINHLNNAPLFITNPRQNKLNYLQGIWSYDVNNYYKPITDHLNIIQEIISKVK